MRPGTARSAQPIVATPPQTAAHLVRHNRWIPLALIAELRFLMARGSDRKDSVIDQSCLVKVVIMLYSPCRDA